MFKNPWVRIAIELAIKMSAFYLFRKALEKAVVRQIDKNPDLLKMFVQEK